MKKNGGHAGHNGLRSSHQQIGEADDRVRLGIGHPGHKDRVAGYVLSDFAKAEQDWLDDMMRGISDGAVALAQGDGPKFLNAIALRVSPPRSGTGTAQEPNRKSKSEKFVKAEQPIEEDTRSPMEKLVDRFR